MLDNNAANGLLWNGVEQSKEFNAAQYVGDDIYDPAYKSNGSGWYNKTNALKDVLDYNNDGTAVNSIEVVINSGNVLPTGKSIDVIAMLRKVAVTTLPEGTADQVIADDKQIILDIHTDKGLIRDIKLAYKYTATKGTLADNRLITNVTTNHAIEAVGDGKKVKVTFDDTALDKPHDMEVKGNDELANLIHWNVDNQTDIVANLLSNVTISKSMYNELANSLINTFTIKGNKEVTIASDVPAGALDLFVFDGVAKIKVYGTQTLAKDKSVAIENYGTLNVTGNKKAIKSISNYGTLNIKNNVNSGDIYNYGSMSVVAGNTVSTEVINSYPDYYRATINNAGTILKLNNKSWGTVNNTGIVGTAAQAADITNDVVNSGTVINTGSSEAYIGENTGSVYAKETSTSRVNDNTIGNIVITELGTDGNFMADETGNIVQEIAAPTNTDGVDKRANTIWLTSTLKVEKKNADDEFVDVNLSSGAMFGKVQIIAKGLNARIDGNGKALKLGQLQINASSKLVLNNVNVKLFAQTISSNEKFGLVWMHGTYNNGVKQAVFTVNSNASVTGYNSSNNVTEILTIAPSADYKNSTYNKVDNNSKSKIVEGIRDYLTQDYRTSMQ